MNYSELKIQEQYIGITVGNQFKPILLTNDMSDADKAYVYNRISKKVFDIYKNEEVDTNTKVDTSDKKIEIVIVETKTKPKTVKKKTSKKEKTK